MKFDWGFGLVKSVQEREGQGVTYAQGDYKDGLWNLNWMGKTRGDVKGVEQ